MVRITKTEKWKDSFFLKLKPIDKLIFIYFYENCDDSGILDISFPKMAAEIGISNNEISAGLKSLEKTFIVSVDADKIWIKKFLLHQNRLPLDLKTPEGNFIKYQLENNLQKFNNSSEMQDIIKNIKKLTKSKPISEFVKPSLEEVINKYKSGEWSMVSEQEIVQIYDYYESVGWKVGSKKMADWNKSFIGCFRRNLNRRPRQGNSSVGSTKMDAIIQGNEKMAGFDFNTLPKK
jgi:hypothetical protein